MPGNNNGATEEENRREVVADGEAMDVEEAPDTGNTTVRKTENVKTGIYPEQEIINKNIKLNAHQQTRQCQQYTTQMIN